MYNHAAQVYNHTFFWNSMTPHQSEISPEVSASICSTWGSIDGFKKEFSAVAAGHFGSGWAWLCAKKDGSLEICSTANQDNPLMEGIGCEGYPIMGIDVWEHAYYLNYQNRRPDYINAFFNVVDWSIVGEKFAKATN